MIRWYAVGELSGDRLVSPLSGEPVIFDAPDKSAAMAHVAKCFPAHSLKPQSVVEWEALREMESAAKRFLDASDKQLAEMRARDEMVREMATGQCELLTMPAVWRERAA